MLGEGGKLGCIALGLGKWSELRKDFSLYLVIEDLTHKTGTCLVPGWPQLGSGLPFGPRSQASLQKAQGPGPPDRESHCEDRWRRSWRGLDR